MRLFALCNKYFQWSAFFSRNYPLNQDVSPSPHNFLHVLWHFPGHFLLRRQFLHVLPPKPGCFPTATQFPPCFVALPGTFSSAAAVSPCFAPKTRMFLHRRGHFSRNCGVFRDILLPRWLFLLDLWRFPGHFLLRRQFLHVLPAKPGCFPTAPQFPP